MQEKPLYTLDKLKEIDDSEEFFAEVIDIFVRTVPANAESMVKACNEEDWNNVYFFAHKIKANINLLNIESIINEVKFVEQSAKEQKNLPDIPDKANYILDSIKKVIQQFKSDFPDTIK